MTTCKLMDINQTMATVNAEQRENEKLQYILSQNTLGDDTKNTQKVVYKDTSESIINRNKLYSPKVLRRMNGFLIEIVENEAKVGLIDNGNTYEYYLPVKHLKEAKITGPNQPFQMDEIEIKTDTGYIVGYEFQPLAQIGDAIQDSFKLDEERERKRKLIMKHFSSVKA